MPLVNISPQGKNQPGIWGFHNVTNKKQVAEAVKEIAGKLSGSGHTIHIMTGTHGHCSGRVGQVATRDERFLKEDQALLAPTNSDRKPVSLVVHDFNTNVPAEPDLHTAAMAKLNQDMRSLVPEGKAGLQTFLLAYCCSAGVPKTR